MPKDTPKETTETHKRKCLLVGDEGVGKTCIVLANTWNEFPSEPVPRIFMGFEEVMIGGERYELTICDSECQASHDRVRPLSYPQTDVFLVCFSVVNPASFEHVKEKWVPEIGRYCPKIRFILVGTQIDLREKEKEETSKLNNDLAENKLVSISTEQGENLAKELKAVKYVECSAKSQKGVKNVFDDAILATLAFPRKTRSQCCVS